MIVHIYLLAVMSSITRSIAITTPVVRLKSGYETLLLNGEGYVGVASSALLYYQNNKTTELSLAILYMVIGISSR
jgi:hypothetical protein